MVIGMVMILTAAAFILFYVIPDQWEHNQMDRFTLMIAGIGTVGTVALILTAG